MTRAEQSAIIKDYIEKQLPTYKELALDIHAHPKSVTMKFTHQMY